MKWKSLCNKQGWRQTKRAESSASPHYSDSFPIIPVSHLCRGVRRLASLSVRSLIVSICQRCRARVKKTLEEMGCHSSRRSNIQWHSHEPIKTSKTILHCWPTSDISPRQECPCIVVQYTHTHINRHLGTEACSKRRVTPGTGSDRVPEPWECPRLRDWKVQLVSKLQRGTKACWRISSVTQLHFNVTPLCMQIWGVVCNPESFHTRCRWSHKPLWHLTSHGTVLCVVCVKSFLTCLAKTGGKKVRLSQSYRLTHKVEQWL